MSEQPMDQATAAEQGRVLRQAYLRLMFRNRRKVGAPPKKTNAVASMGFSVLLFAAMGMMAFNFRTLGLAAFSASLHALTFLMVGINLATSSGSLLFNGEEADVLLHRPIQPRALLMAKVRVIVQVSLALAVALNVCGMLLAALRPGGTWLFVPAHLASLTLEVIFCASFIALAYNLCLRWFGRERLENLMTAVQVAVAMGAIMGGQLVPHLLRHLDPATFTSPPLWLAALPPVWFAALDTALCGAAAASSGIWIMAALGILATLATAWLGVSRMAGTYEQGLVSLNEAGPGAHKPGAVRGRRIASLLRLPGIRFWLRDPVERASFRLTFAGLSRSRGVKLRVYPMLAQFMIMPVIFLGGTSRTTDNFMLPFAIAFAGAFIGMLPATVLDALRMSEDWHAADIFRQAPMPRVAALFEGSRKAVILLLCGPGLLLIMLAGFFLLTDRSQLLLLLPGILALPVFSLLPGLGRVFLPFADAPEVQVHNARGCLMLFGFMAASMTVAGLSGWAWNSHWFGWLLLGELACSAALSLALRSLMNRRQGASIIHP